MQTLTQVAEDPNGDALGTDAPPSRGRRRRLFVRPSSRTILTILISIPLIYLVIGPIGVLIFSSFRESRIFLPFESGATWTLDNYRDVFANSSTYETLGNTAVFALGSLALSFSISVMLALLVERTDIPFQRMIYIAIIAQLGIPTLISALGWNLLLSPRAGYLNVLFRDAFGLTGDGPVNLFSMAGMIFVQATALVPMTFLLLSAAFKAMDVSLEEAAMASGATSRVTMLRITLPLLLPALLSAAIYEFVTVIETLDVPLVIGLRAHEPVLSLQIYRQVESTSGSIPNFGLACTYSLFVLVLVLAPLLYYNRIISRASRYSTVTGKGYRPRRYSLGRMKPIATAAALLVVFVTSVLPIVALVWTSLSPYPAGFSASAFDRLTFSNFTDLFASEEFLTALGNTVVVGIAAAIGAMALGLLVGWVIVRGRSRRWSRTMDVIAFLPHAAPGVIIGLSVLLVYLVIPNPLYQTVWIIALAIMTQAVSLSTRLMSGALVQVDEGLEEAGAAAGARWRQVVARILLPLTSRPFLNGTLLVFLLAIKNLTLALILYGPDSNVLSTLIWSRYEQGSLVAASAMGTCLVAIAFVVTALARRLGDVSGIKE